MFGLFKKRAAAAVEFVELKAYANGSVHARRYYGNDVDAAAARFGSKHAAAAVVVVEFNYYGVAVNEYVL